MADKSLQQLMVRPGSRFSLSRHDPDATLGWDKLEARAELAALVPELDALQERLAAEAKQSLLVVLQAIDCGGKDGTIRKVFGPLNAAGVRVSSFKAPNDDELAHDYLRRAHAVTPARGEIAVWNRSHYEDVLVVRVRNLVPKAKWEKRYRHIREFEQLLSDEGTRILKFNLHISKDEQRQRLQDRVDDPRKHWKFRASDLDDRALWPKFMKAYEVAFAETSTDVAPWYVIPANRKWVRNLAIARILLSTLEDMNPQLPPDDPAIAGMTIV